MRALAVIAIVCAASVGAAQPAIDHYRAGLALLKKHDYAAAAAEFSAAYAIDPAPKHLFNLALAQRLGGACKEAIESYRAYLDTNPPAVNAKNARIGIERCEAALAAQPAPDAEDKQPPTDPAPPIVEDKPRTEPPRTEPVGPAPSRTEPPGTQPAGTEASRTGPVNGGKQARDRLGTLLLVGGGASAVASLSFYLLARDAASTTHDTGPLSDFESGRDRARTMQVSSWIAGGLAIGLLTGAVIRIATRKADVVVTPVNGGGGVVLGGRF